MQTIFSKIKEQAMPRLSTSRREQAKVGVIERVNHAATSSRAIRASAVNCKDGERRTRPSAGRWKPPQVHLQHRRPKQSRRQSPHWTIEPHRSGRTRQVQRS